MAPDFPPFSSLLLLSVSSDQIDCKTQRRRKKREEKEEKKKRRKRRREGREEEKEEEEEEVKGLTNYILINYLHIIVFMHHIASKIG